MPVGEFEKCVRAAAGGAPASEAVLVGMETRWYSRPVIMHWTEPSEKDSHIHTLENSVTTFAAAALGRIATLEAQIHCFRRTRGLLLPHLLSGQLELKPN